MHTSVVLQLCEGQRITLTSWFSPSVLLGLSGQTPPSGLCSKHLTHRDTFLVQKILFYRRVESFSLSSATRVSGVHGLQIARLNVFFLADNQFLPVDISSATLLHFV